jgi:opacity protein-like surface antigen
MKKIASLLMTVALASSVFAGSAPVYSGKSGKAVMAPPPPACDWFAPGFKVGANVSGILFNEGGDSSIGGGVLAEYFFCENFGVEGSYNLFATDSEHHQFDLNLVARFPMLNGCWAPYVLAGGGFATNGESDWNWQVGGGVEAHLSGNMGIFADGAYHWSEGPRDYTIVRVGLKFRL